MADIQLVWDGANARGDWQIADGDLATGNDLATAVLISLFTDRRASDDFTPPDGDQRGWWGDTYAPGMPLGSRLWQLERAVISNRSAVLQQAKRTCEEALQWLLDNEIAASVAVTTQWIGLGALGISVTITEPGTGAPQKFEWAWTPKAAPLSPAQPTTDATWLLDYNFTLDQGVLA